MSKRKFRELKAQSSEELQGKLQQSRVQLFQIKLDRDMGKEVATAQFWKLRKDICMIHTIQTERTKDQS